jgi:hypothetical protein
MTEPTDRNSSADAAVPPDVAVDALKHVVDDDTNRQQWLEWTAAQLLGGMSFESAESALRQAGWTDGDASSIVEEARVATRELRGVKTREAVAEQAEESYRKTIASAKYFMFGFPLFFLALRNVIRAIKNVRGGAGSGDPRDPPKNDAVA